MKPKTFFTLLLICSVFYSCEDDLKLTDQKVFFEVHYLNSAWFYTNNGIMIDSLGQIHTFDIKDNQDSWVYTEPTGYISQSDMNKNLSLCTTAQGITVSTDSLKYYVEKIDNAARGKLSQSEIMMADAGSLQYIAYVYEPHKKRYKKILLHQWGDIQINNSSKAAQELTTWLLNLRNSIGLIN